MVLTKGKLVSDETVAEVVQARLSREDVQRGGCLLDGFPRTLPQSELLDGILEASGVKLTRVVLLEAARDLLVRRLTARRVCRGCRAVYNIFFMPPAEEGICDACGKRLEQRTDDNAATVANRLDVYAKETAPLVAVYEERGILSRLDSGGEADACFASLCALLGV